MASGVLFQIGKCKFQIYMVPAWACPPPRKIVFHWGTINNRLINQRTAISIWHINNAKKERGYIVRFLWFGARIVLPRKKNGSGKDQ